MRTVKDHYGWADDNKLFQFPGKDNRGRKVDIDVPMKVFVNLLAHCYVRNLLVAWAESCDDDFLLKKYFWDSNFPVRCSEGFT